ncbi:MAG: PQQ-binding-like beta-propeller repeat protein [Solirubrobacteraceae bacterium]
MSEPIETRRREAPSDSPYLGLSYYMEEFAGLFFGRDSERTLVIGNLRAARLTILYAPSGVGKSSLLRAGVAARLRELARRTVAERGSARFIPIVFNSWHDEPLDDLIGEIEATIQPFTSDPRLELPRSGLQEAIEAATAATRATLLVLLDSFEEYFLYGVGESRPGRFADELSQVITRTDVSANFLIAVREDAYAGVGDLFRGKISNPYANTFSLTYLDRDAATQAITKPVERFNEALSEGERIQIEQPLVDAVLDQVRAGEVAFGEQGRGTLAGQDGELDRIETPYLQLVMSALWERERNQGSSVLRLETLEALGGAQAIVRSHLNRAMSELSDAEREAAVDVFNHLVTPSGTKIAHAVADLADYSRGEPRHVRGLVSKLSSGEHRILRPVPPAPGDARPRVEIFHDVLAPAILAWRSAQQSRRLEAQRRAAEERANRERRRARTFRALAVSSSVLLAMAVVGVVIALIETSHAHTAQRQSLSSQLAAQADSDLQNGALARGSLLSLEAYGLDPSSHARTSVVRAQLATGSIVGLLSGHRAYVTSVAYSPDGSIIASGSGDKLVLLQKARTGRTVAVLRGATAPVAAIAFSPDGRWLAAGTEDGRVMIWSVSSGRLLRMVRDPTGKGIWGIAFSPDGALLAYGDGAGKVWLTNATDGHTVRVLMADAQFALAFAPDGRTLATDSPSSGADLWTVGTGARLKHLAGPPLNGVAFSGDGRSLAGAGTNGAVIVWNVKTGATVQTLKGHTGAVNAVAFSPVGGTLASAGADHNVILWSTATGQELHILSGHTDPVQAVAFSPSGQTLVSGGDDAQVIIWGARPGHVERVLSAGSPSLTVAYSPAGPLLASGQADGTVALWDPATGRRLRSLNGHSGPVESVAFSPDGGTIAAGDTDGTVVLWNSRTGARERTLRGHTDIVYSVAFSPDGRTLASASADSTVILWDPHTGAREHTLRGHNDFVFAVAFSPDSKMLASASADQNVILWDVTSGRRLRTLTGHIASVETVAFSPDGRTLASGSDDGSLILWNPQTGQKKETLTAGGRVLSAAFSPNGRLLAFSEHSPNVVLEDLRTGFIEPLPAHAGPALGVAFSPDSRTLATVGLDRTVTLVGPLPSGIGFPAVRARLCQLSRRNLTRAEWNQFLPGRSYQRTCPSF